MENTNKKQLDEVSERNLSFRRNSQNEENKMSKQVQDSKDNILKRILTKNATLIQNNIQNNDNIDSKSNSQKQNSDQDKQQKKKGIFQEYQERWSKNNKNIFRKLIIWKVGDDGKIEDQLKLMITYLTIVFILILFISGTITSFSFNYTNQNLIENNILDQARTILGNSILQYSNQTEEIFAGYEYILVYLSDIQLTKLQVSNKLIDYDTIQNFPLLGPGKMHFRTDPQTNCKKYEGTELKFDGSISLECTDWYEYDVKAVPLVHEDVYQGVFPTETLIDSFDVLNYILEEQFLEYFTINIQNIYFGFEQRMTIAMFPGFYLGGLTTYNMYARPWYQKTRNSHLNAKDNKVFRVVTKPYYDAIIQSKVVTVSRPIVLPNKQDTKKRYQVGKGQLLGVASVDITTQNFQSMFEQLHFYQTGYFFMVDSDGYPFNEPEEFKKQITMNGEIQLEEGVELNVKLLLSEEDWNTILEGNSDQPYGIIETVSLQNLEVIIASKVNSQNFYEGQSMINLIIIPRSEIYGDIQQQKDQNFKNLLITSFVSFGIFLILSILCSIFVKKQIVKMVSSITQLNQSALNLIDNQQEDNQSPLIKNENNPSPSVDSENKVRQEVMRTLVKIQKSTQSQTIQQLVKGFQNQLQGISQLGKGEQNILKNSKGGLTFEKGMYSNTNIMEYIDPLISHMNDKIKNIGNEYELNQNLTISEKINTSCIYRTKTKDEKDQFSLSSQIDAKQQFNPRRLQQYSPFLTMATQNSENLQTLDQINI